MIFFFFESTEGINGLLIKQVMPNLWTSLQNVNYASEKVNITAESFAHSPFGDFASLLSMSLLKNRHNPHLCVQMW